MKRPKQPQSTLGSRLRDLRIAAGKHQRDTAHDLGVTEGTVSRWELDKVVPLLEQLIALSKLYGVTIDEIAKGAEVIESHPPPPTELAEFLASREGRLARERGYEPALLSTARTTPKPLSKRQWKLLAHALTMEDEEG